MKKPESCLVTGGAGFIGSHLVDLLLADSDTEQVVVVDDFSSGRLEHLEARAQDQRLVTRRVDLLNGRKLLAAVPKVDLVFHLAANPDARRGISNTKLDLEQETIATRNLLQVMLHRDIKKIVFASSGCVYGDVGTQMVDETHGPCLPLSLYGAGKLASEGLISAFCGTFGMSAVILRFGNVIGPRCTHGLLYDLMRKLERDSGALQVLGNGSQSKPYIHVCEIAQALLWSAKRFGFVSIRNLDLFNVAPFGSTRVYWIVHQLLAQLGLQETTRVAFQQQDRGWPGDIPQSRMDGLKIHRAGFTLERSSDKAVCDGIADAISWERAHGRLEEMGGTVTKQAASP